MADEARFTSDEQGRVVLIRGEERLVLGVLKEVGEEMCRFLREIDLAGCPGKPRVNSQDGERTSWAGLRGSPAASKTDQ